MPSSSPARTGIETITPHSINPLKVMRHGDPIFSPDSVDAGSFSGNYMYLNGNESSRYD
jgi:hypothetical protein